MGVVAGGGSEQVKVFYLACKKIINTCLWQREHNEKNINGCGFIPQNRRAEQKGNKTI